MSPTIGAQKRYPAFVSVLNEPDGDARPWFVLEMTFTTFASLG